MTLAPRVRRFPMAATARRAPSLSASTAHRRLVNLGLWLPLTPLFLVLSPVALIAAPFTLLSAEGRGAGGPLAIWRIGRLLLSLSGTEVRVETQTARIRIRIF